ncbi:MAG: type II toxin-antitoxin system RelB/DinJ family antitoxin [Bacillota bacterium]|nr:type II toxin-antitoxin system RelB/DinJ family antitoxin [Bacillota bacterium]
MAKTASVFTRVDPKIKQEAEGILENLGLSMSTAMDIFLRQIVINNGLPFEVKLPSQKPTCLNSLTEEEFDKAMEEGIKEVEEGKTIPLDEVVETLKKERGI